MSSSGARFLFGEFLSTLSFSAFIATGVILVLLRSVVRRTWAADALFVVLLPSALTPPYPVSIAAMVNWLGSVLFGAATLWILRRFGLLALAAMGCANALMTGLPLAAASWYAPSALTTPLLIAAAAAWSLYVILTSRPGRASRSAADPLVGAAELARISRALCIA